MGRLPKRIEYYLFVRFFATPKHFRDLKTQMEFQIEYNVSHGTLANWKNDPHFWEDVDRAVKEWAKEKTPDVIAAMYARIMKTGDPQAIKLWLQYIQGWAEKMVHEKEIGENLAEAISEEQKNKIRLAFSNFGVVKEISHKEPEDTKDL